MGAMLTGTRSRFVTHEGGLPLLPPFFAQRHEPGVRRVRLDYAYRPPPRTDCRLSLERQETSRPAPVDVLEADRRRRADFPGQVTCRYPSKLVEGALRAELGRRHALAESAFVFGNGIMSLLSTVYSAYARSGDRIVVPTPGFWPAYSFAVQRGVGVLMPTYTLERGEGSGASFRFPREDVERALERRETRLCYLCSPDNPTGATLSDELVSDLAGAFPSKLFVVDCAYWAYDQFERSSAGTIRDGLALHVASRLVREGAPNVLGAFTFSKHYALANHRVGYLIGHPDLIDTITCLLSPYGMSELDLAVAYYNLKSDAYAEENVRSVARNKRRFEALLRELGQPFVSGHHNAISLAGRHWFAAFAEQGIAVRRLDYYEGIPNPLEDHVRVAIPSDHEQIELLLDATRAALAGRGDAHAAS
jgi:histidinol-phosphate aminotransferase